MCVTCCGVCVRHTVVVCVCVVCDGVCGCVIGTMGFAFCVCMCIANMLWCV